LDPIGPKKFKIPLQKKFNNEKWSFYHNLSSPNQKFEKYSILEIFGPIRFYQNRYLGSQLGFV
jgi:hypothetical protein